MPGLWDGMKKAAVQGAARVAVGAENAARKLEIQRRLGQQEGQVEARYAAIGRLTVAAMRSGAPGPGGAEAHLRAIEAAEAEIASLNAEHKRLGG